MTRRIILAIMFMVIAKSSVAGEIVAKVNDVPISSYDLDSYMKMTVAMSNIKLDAEGTERLRGQILDQLIEQKIKLQAIKKADITVQDEDVLQAIANIEEQSGTPKGSLEQTLKQNNISIHMLKERILTDLGWFKLVNIKFGNRISVSEKEIETEMEKLKQENNKPFVHLYEIFIPVESVLVDNNIYAKAKDLVEEIRKDVSNFSGYAQQFSKSPSYAKGGNIGWLPEELIPPEFQKFISTAKPNSVSDPVRTVDGYYILLLKERRLSMDDKAMPKMTKENVLIRIRGMKLEQFSRKFFRDLEKRTTIEKM